MLIQDAQAMTRSRKNNPPKHQKPVVPADPLSQVTASRQRDQAAMLKMRQQLDKMIYEMQRNILASRAKFNAARWKMINKSMDD